MAAKTKPPAAHGAHWPAGKRRHADTGDWSAIRLDLTSLINDHYLVGMRSNRALAEAVGASERAVRRWLSGEDRPSPEMQDRCRAWATDQKRRLRRK
jgi:hypothetical protein